ncbi:MAG: FKBP-type peptidyl-prolyl cis-trans isomerase [Myxococcaceae bacterium]
MHPKPWFLLALLALASPSLAAAPDGGVPAPPKPEVAVGPLKTADEKALYVLAYATARNWEVLDLSKAEQDIMKKGIADALAGTKPLVPLQEYGPRIKTLVETRQPLAAAARAKKDQPFLDKMAKEKGAQSAPDGLVYISVTEGTGAQPKGNDVAKVQYRGTFVDGSEFDSTYRKGQPAELPLDHVIPCWSEGVQKMKVGGKAKFACPASIGYKDKGEPRGGIPGGAGLVFEVELLEVKPPPPPPTPTPGMPPTPR